MAVAIATHTTASTLLFLDLERRSNDAERRSTDAERRSDVVAEDGTEDDKDPAAVGSGSDLFSLFG